MKLIIDTEKMTVEAEGKTTKALFKIYGKPDIKLNRKITLENMDYWAAPVFGVTTLSISLFAVREENEPKAGSGA